VVFATMTAPGNSQSGLGNLQTQCNTSADCGGGTCDPILGACDASAYTLSYDQDSTRLRLVQAGGGTPIELKNATHIMNKTTTWPKFAPFIQNGGSLVFFTFSAKFDYGFVVTDGMTPQLWMSAIDLSKAKADIPMDPSYTPFWLPFQNPKEANHSGIWTTDVACSTEGTGSCPAEFSCVNGVCMPDKIM
jgi:hypothetical protein